MFPLAKPHLDGEIKLSELRQGDFSRLDTLQQTYLDYTGAALYPTSLVKQHSQSLMQSVLGNPHSNNPSSSCSSTQIRTAKNDVLNFFEADANIYEVIFTANATAAIKLVAESFAFQAGSRLLLTADNHNSINGIREYAAGKNAAIEYLALNPDLSLFKLEDKLNANDPIKFPSLFAYPAQSNFSGIQYSLDLVHKAQSLGYQVLLDAAAFAPSNRLSLSDYPADFVCISFYKMFGYPTGIGALIARKSRLNKLNRPWFSGGTVEYASTQHRMHQLSPGAAAYEDGTLNFASAQAVSHGLNFLNRIGIDEIKQHCSQLGERLINHMSKLRHTNDSPLIRFYGGSQLDYGNARAFNILNNQGELVSYEDIEARSAKAGISIRGGCFCNPGCAESALELPPDTMAKCFNHMQDQAFSYKKLAQCLERSSVGALRVSWGLANNQQDIDHFIEFLKSLTDSQVSTLGNSAQP